MKELKSERNTFRRITNNTCGAGRRLLPSNILKNGKGTPGYGVDKLRQNIELYSNPIFCKLSVWLTSCTQR